MNKAHIELIQKIAKNLIVAITVSIVMLNLGAALGVLSGRGIVAGMLSAGIISIITSFLSGARVQGSGLTAPMSAITAVIIAKASEKLLQDYPSLEIGLFINIVLIEMGALLIIAGALRLGRFIRYVPQLVVAGFMSGIAIMIWYLQLQLFTGGGQKTLDGALAQNIFLLVLTVACCFALPIITKNFKFIKAIPAPLIALIAVSFFANITAMDVAFTQIDDDVTRLDSLIKSIPQQLPLGIELHVWLLALPFALQLAGLCYLDTLLTSLVISKMRKSDGKYSKDLMAQGVSNALTSLIGGVPGAQSTVPSVMMVKEGATLRVCGVAAGVIVLGCALMFSQLLSYIPMAVFSGILVKVGFDIFDSKAVLAYLRTVKKSLHNRPHKILGHKEMAFFSGTALATAFIDLIAAVGIFSALYHLVSRLRIKKPLCDYTP